ncbi:MAG TPA: ABC transporter permease [Ktedonobacterales bacterium]|nr:ABC transporter permease [Ktedonobacterales bacterium]
MNKSARTSPLSSKPTVPLTNGNGPATIPPLTNESGPATPPQRPLAVSRKRSNTRKRQRGGASLFQSAGSALEALNSNKLRSLLTTLGIIIGVGAVIVMISISQGASASTTSRLGSLGPNVLTIIPGSTRVGGVNQGAGSRQTLTQADADAIASQVNNVSGVSPVINIRGQIIFQDQNYQTTTQGVYPAYQQIGAWTMAEGAFFSDADESSNTMVAVVGQTVMQNLFTPLGVDPVGQTIRISGQPFTVVGVLAAKGASGLGNADDVVYIPFSTATQRLSSQSFVSQIAVQASSANAVNQVQADIQSLLEQRHNIPSGGTDDFTIRNQNQLLQTAEGVATTLTFLLVGVAAVSLVVGGIGIMNIMLVSVTERTREIGIRMAVGARRRDILSQFLIEAIFLSGVGGLIGIGIGVVAAIEVSKLGNLPEQIALFSVLLAFGVSALVGVLFGLYPAWRASRLDPITALRVD